MLLSFIVPTIRTEFLARAVSSILAQGHQDIELILINDGAGSAIRSSISEFEDDRLRYIENITNQGSRDPSKIWNQGLGLARGDLVCFVGDDDYISSNYAATIVALAEGHQDCALFRTRLEVVDEKEAVLYYGLSLPEYESWDENVYFRTRFRRPQSTCEFVARTSVLRAMGGFVAFPLAWGSDDATWISLAAHGGIVSTNEAWGFWRQHGTNISSLDFGEEKKEAQRLFCEWLMRFGADNEAKRIEKSLLLAAIKDRYADSWSIPKPKWRTVAWIVKKAVQDIMRQVRSGQN